MVFRSIAAPASLKLAGRSGGWRPAKGVFRSIAAPASLKRKASPLQHLYEPFRFPEHRCSGLIEAPSFALRQTVTTEKFSGASLLRPH